MFFPTQPLMRASRRLALTTKRARKGFYKGNRVGAMGRHTRTGGYIVMPEKVRTYVVPAFDPDFYLTPFVTEIARAPLESLREAKGIWTANWKFTGAHYLQEWKKSNALEGQPQ